MSGFRTPRCSVGRERVAVPAPVASAGEVASWNGEYVMVLSTNAKSGTSIAASQNEFAHRTSVTLSSSCTAGVCIATVNNPPAQERIHAAHNRIHLERCSVGARDDLAWDCLLPDGTVETPGEIDNGLHARAVRNPHRRLPHRYLQRRMQGQRRHAGVGETGVRPGR